MKPYLLSLCLLFVTMNCAFSQGIRFEKDSLPVLIEKAKQSDRPIMIFLDAIPAQKGSVQETERNLFNNADVATKMQDAFICYKATFASPESKKLSVKYGITAYPTFIFLNNYGVLVHRTFGFYATADKYIQLADYVVNSIKSGNNIAAHSNRYKTGERSRQFLFNYIISRERLGYYDNSDLIDDYVDQLTLKEVNTYTQMLFILQAGPVVGSRALQVSYLFKPLRDSVYKTQPKAMATAFNTRTIKNTFDLAIAKKDKNLAFQGATFAQGAYGKDYLNGQRANQSHMLNFYKAINDTVTFLQQAAYFYDRFYMTVSIDSAHRFQQRVLDSLKSQHERDAAKFKDSPTARLFYTQLPAGNPFATGLNTGAWDVYKTGTHNEVHLSKAITWAKRSIAIEPNYHNLDTYAHLLYQMGFYAEAESQQRNAIKLAEDKKVPKEGLAELNSVLSKIRERTL